VATFAHASTVSFAGVNIGQLVNVTVSGGSAVTADVSGFDSPIYGVGGNSRLVREIDAVAVEPGAASVRLIGMPPFTTLQIGQKGALSVSTPGGGLAGEAILLRYEVEGSVGDLLRGSAEFQLTGS
jgi:hypothetical protein